MKAGRFLNWKEEFPRGPGTRWDNSCFRAGDMFEFSDGLLGILTERFNIYPEMHPHKGSYAWRMEFFPPSKSVPNTVYSGERYGISEINLYNIHKSKCVSRGVER